MPSPVRLADADLGNHERSEARNERGDKVAKPRHLEDEGAPPARLLVAAVESRRQTLSRGQHKRYSMFSYLR
eukprot:2490637-Heterocapsa_arctica.AAC.1